MNTELIVNLALIVAGVTAIAAGLLIADRRERRRSQEMLKKEEEREMGGPCVD